MIKNSILLIFMFISAANAEMYKVYVKRLDNNLYKDINSGFVIKTKWCYHYTYGETAILKYNEYSIFDNKIIFDDGTICDVEKII